MSKRNRIGLITDSTCNVPAEMIKQYDIYVIAQYLIWGTQELRDQIDIDSATFYQRLKTDPVHPKTSQPTPADFNKLIELAQANGAEEIVMILISNQLSGTFASARQAQQAASIPVHLHDSLSAGMGLGWQVIAAARARENGGDAQTMIEAARKVNKTEALTLTVDTLDYLHKGGRIGGAQKLIGTALNLKPQLYLDHQQGRIMPGERTRTRTKALERVYAAYFEKMDTSKPLHIAVMHVDAKADAEAFSKRIQEQYKPAELVTVEITPVVGVHVGPGTVGIGGYYEA